MGYQECVESIVPIKEQGPGLAAPPKSLDFIAVEEKSPKGNSKQANSHSWRCQPYTLNLLLPLGAAVFCWVFD